jgi:hypothetical protein
MEPRSELPPISDELAVIRMLYEAHVRTLKPSARERFEAQLETVIAESVGVLPLVRRPMHLAKVMAARKAGGEWLLRLIETSRERT